jgi:hypothetical protein
MAQGIKNMQSAETVQSILEEEIEASYAMYSASQTECQ